MQLVDGAGVDEVLAEWTEDLAAELDAIDLFDVQAGSTVYRVFLLPGNLQVDLSLAPRQSSGRAAPISGCCSGPRRSARPGRPARRPSRAGLGTCSASAPTTRCGGGSASSGAGQAERWISGTRDQALALACRRRGLHAAHGRGLDRLPTESLARLKPALVGSLRRRELLRALDAPWKGCCGRPTRPAAWPTGSHHDCES